ncbi:MAG: hypothetical protein AB9856_02185 [Cellulosilyticaceae bacterium]
MKNLVTKKVHHEKYGAGSIENAEGRYLSIKFETIPDVKKFIYPDSFKAFLAFQENEEQKKVDKILDEKYRIEAEIAENKRIECERQLAEQQAIKLEELKKKRKRTKSTTTK